MFGSFIDHVRRVYGYPDVVTLLKEDLEEAERNLVVALALQEEANANVTKFVNRIARIQASLARRNK